MKESKSEYLNRREAAEMLRVNIKKFRSLVEMHLPRYHFGPKTVRFKRSEIEEAAEKHFKEEPYLT